MLSVAAYLLAAFAQAWPGQNPVVCATMAAIAIDETIAMMAIFVFIFMLFNDE